MQIIQERVALGEGDMATPVDFEQFDSEALTPVEFIECLEVLKSSLEDDCTFAWLNPDSAEAIRIAFADLARKACKLLPDSEELPISYRDVTRKLRDMSSGGGGPSYLNMVCALDELAEVMLQTVLDGRILTRPI